VSENDSSTPEFQASITSLWEDLKQLTKEVVAEMNRTDELRTKTGGLDCSFADRDAIAVTNHSSPSMEVTIRRRSALIHVHTRTAIQGAERESWESFAVEIADSSALLRNREGDALTIERTVFHILRPFLHLQAIAN